MHARFVCVFKVFERSRFTTLQRNGVTPMFACVLSVKMALVPSKPHLAPSRQPISKMTQKTLFPRIVQGPLGCHLLSSLVPKSRFRGSGKKVFPRCKMTFKMMQNYPLSIFHPSVRPESSPGADLSTFQKFTFSLFLNLFGPFGPF